jgi:predicted site-specific integrase-resolvase
MIKLNDANEVSLSITYQKNMSRRRAELKKFLENQTSKEQKPDVDIIKIIEEEKARNGKENLLEDCTNILQSILNKEIKLEKQEYKELKSWHHHSRGYFYTPDDRRNHIA